MKPLGQYGTYVVHRLFLNPWQTLMINHGLLAHNFKRGQTSAQRGVNSTTTIWLNLSFYGVKLIFHLCFKTLDLHVNITFSLLPQRKFRTLFPFQCSRVLWKSIDKHVMEPIYRLRNRWCELCLLYFFYFLSSIPLKASSPTDLKLQYNFVHFVVVLLIKSWSSHQVHDQVIVFEV